MAAKDEKGACKRRRRKNYIQSSGWKRMKCGWLLEKPIDRLISSSDVIIDKHIENI